MVLRSRVPTGCAYNGCRMPLKLLQTGCPTGNVDFGNACSATDPSDNLTRLSHQEPVPRTWTGLPLGEADGMGIVVHEYAHGISTRLTGGPANSNCLGWGEAGGMGEGWGDVSFFHCFGLFAERWWPVLTFVFSRSCSCSAVLCDDDPDALQGRERVRDGRVGLGPGRRDPQLPLLAERDCQPRLLQLARQLGQRASDLGRGTTEVCIYDFVIQSRS